jgi:mono/diheme cytochrome c family protein
MKTHPNGTMKRMALWSLAGLALVAGLGAAPVRIELPVEAPVLKPGPGRDIALSHCLTCHSAEYFTTQPLLPRAYWQGAVEKMQAKFGATVPAEQVAPLVDYLFGSYGKKP